MPGEGNWEAKDGNLHKTYLHFVQFGWTGIKKDFELKSVVKNKYADSLII